MIGEIPHSWLTTYLIDKRKSILDIIYRLIKRVSSFPFFFILPIIDFAFNET